MNKQRRKDNAFKKGDRIKLWSGSCKPRPPELMPDHVYVVEDIILDRVVIDGRLYFASRFMLLGESK